VHNEIVSGNVPHKQGHETPIRFQVERIEGNLAGTKDGVAKTSWTQHWTQRRGLARTGNDLDSTPWRSPGKASDKLGGIRLSVGSVLNGWQKIGRVALSPFSGTAVSFGLHVCRPETLLWMPLATMFEITGETGAMRFA